MARCWASMEAAEPKGAPEWWMTIACQRPGATAARVRKMASIDCGPAAATAAGSASPSRRGVGPPWRIQRRPPTVVIEKRRATQTLRERATGPGGFFARERARGFLLIPGVFPCAARRRQRQAYTPSGDRALSLLKTRAAR